MNKTRYGLIAICILLSSVMSAEAQVSIGIGLPNVSIGINLPLYPELAPVPGYPVYYAPQVNANYFFYDGMYWVYQDDGWYASSWYNGPWGYVRPEVVPLYVLRVPVRYYRQPPPYFRGWRQNAPPRWGQHWGPEWEQHRSGWDTWKRSSVPARAPLPVYQRQYSGDRYPRVEQQHELRNEQYRYQPRNSAVREHYNQQLKYGSPAPGKREGRDAPPGRNSRQQETPRSTPPHQQGGPVDSRSQPPYQPPQQQRGTSYQEQQAPRSQDREQRPQNRGESQESDRGHGHGQNKDDDRGRGRNN
jgi:hypothetical protein